MTSLTRLSGHNQNDASIKPSINTKIIQQKVSVSPTKLRRENIQCGSFSYKSADGLVTASGTYPDGQGTFSYKLGIISGPQPLPTVSTPQEFHPPGASALLVLNNHLSLVSQQFRVIVRNRKTKCLITKITVPIHLSKYDLLSPHSAH